MKSKYGIDRQVSGSGNGTWEETCEKTPYVHG